MDPGQLAHLACLWEVSARKTGNVHRQRDFANLHFNDFVKSAAAIAPVLTHACQQSVGQTIFDAIQATRRVVSTNTNLGIVLLLTPLAAVPEHEPLALGLERVLERLDVADSRLVFAAIRLAQPGGLGQAAEQDVHWEPTLPLRAIMALSAERDLVARQYANGFREVLEEGVPCLRRRLEQQIHDAERRATMWCDTPRRNVEQAIILTHLDILAQHPDSLIARKKGLDVAQEVSRRAGDVADMAEPARSRALADLDAWLFAAGLNPGTSADLITACLFIALREGILKIGDWQDSNGGEGV